MTDAEAAMERRSLDVLSVSLPAPQFPAIDRAFALLSRRLRLPFAPMLTAAPAADEAQPDRQQQRRRSQPAPPMAASGLTPAAERSLPPVVFPLPLRLPASPLPLLAVNATTPLPACPPAEGQQQREQREESSCAPPAAAAEEAEQAEATQEEKKSEQTEAPRDIATLRCAWLQWRRRSAEQRQLRLQRQATAERQHRRRLQAATWAEWEAAMTARSSVSHSLLALADGWRRRRLLLLVCSAWSRRCRQRRAVRLRCRQRLRVLGERGLSSGYSAARVRHDDGTFAMAEGWDRHRVLAQAWRGWLQRIACPGLPARQ